MHRPSLKLAKMNLGRPASWCIRGTIFPLLHARRCVWNRPSHRRKHIANMDSHSAQLSLGNMQWYNLHQLWNFCWYYMERGYFYLLGSIPLFKKISQENRRQRKSRLRRWREFAAHATPIPTAMSSLVLWNYTYMNPAFSSLAPLPRFVSWGWNLGLHTC